MTQPGITLFGANGSYSRMVESLRDGDTVAIASDMPGRTETTFLGRSVRSASGAARLAVDTGAVIVPVTSHRAGQRYRYRLEDPIHVAAADDYRRVLGRIMAAHEPAVLAWPEAYERPLRRFLPVATEDVARFGYPLDEYFHRFVI
jgi:lauroyl/myristoyl acyltransferase